MAIIKKGIKMAEDAKVDIFFLADATGSMGNCIDNVHENIINTYLESRRNASCNLMMGLGFYRDIDVENDKDEYGVLQKITCGESDLQKAVTSLSENVHGGGDAAESQLYALTQIAMHPESIGWRAGAHRIIVWFGDIYGHSSQYKDGTEYNVSLANEQLYISNISVLAFSMNPTNKLDDDEGGLYVKASQITSKNNGSVTGNVNQYNAIDVIFNYLNENIPGF